MTLKDIRNRVVQAIVLVLLVAAAASAQEFRGTLSGQILDAGSAAVPGAQVVATDIDTGAKYETRSTAEGQYTLPFLAPGYFRLSASANGFKRYIRDRVRVSANERVRLDMTLEVGALAESVTVTAEAPLLEAATGSTGQVINTQQIENMPLNGRTPLVLSQLAFGVIPANDPRNVRPFDNSGASGFSMGGAPSKTNEVLLDGAPDLMASGNGQVAYNPPMDSVQEVKVESFQADAAYGHTGGGTVNVVMKSGTNQLHGTAYWFTQPSVLAATPFFTNAAGQEKSDPLYHQWGTTAGAPLMIPKVLNGRDKVFFFFTYEGMKNDRPSPQSLTVPTPAEINGDFSALLKAGSSYQIYDPDTGTAAGPRINRQPLAGNLIPAPRFNAVAKNFLKFFPAPNQPGLIDGQNNYLSANVEHNIYNNELGRMDFNISNRQKLFFDVRHNERGINAQNALGDGNVAVGQRAARKNYGATLDTVYTFTPTTLLDVRLNWTRFAEYTGSASDGFNMTDLGFPAALSAAATRATMPYIDLNRFSDLGARQDGDTPGDTFQIFTSLTHIRGRHSLKAGTDLRLARTDVSNWANGSGNYTFREQWTNGPADNAAPSPLGQDLAAFVLGLPTAGTFDVNAASSTQAKSYALFLQDDFRVRRDLTLNLGIRYDRDLGMTERYNRAIAGFAFNAPSPISAAAAAAYAKNPISEVPVSQFKTPGGLQFASPGERALYHTQAHYFAPRFGFAWSLNNKTVLRGGTGVFYFPLAGGLYQTGYSISTPLVATLNGYLAPNVTLSNPFPNGIQQPVGAAAGLSTALGQSITFGNPNPLNPYSVRWSLGVQRELGRNLLFQIGYQGNHAVHMATSPQLDSIPSAFLSRSPVRDQAVINRLTANVANPFAGLNPGGSINGSTVALNQLLLPYPQFTGVTMSGLNNGESYMHMLQIGFEKRFSHGLQFLANFSRSKLMQKLSYLNSLPFQELALEKRVADEDRPYRLIASASYELPIHTSSHGWNRLVSGWVLNTIYSAQSGAPLGWGNMLYGCNSLSITPRNVDNAFDTSCFNKVSAQQLSFNLRAFPSVFGRWDNVRNIDISVIKEMAITEKVKVQFRGEAFNAFNRPEFSSPSVSPTGAGFGKVTSQANLPRQIQMALRFKW
jgi:Carboxypeptidase regulatory-like domain